MRRLVRRGVRKPVDWLFADYRVNARFHIEIEQFARSMFRCGDHD